MTRSKTSPSTDRRRARVRSVGASVGAAALALAGCATAGPYNPEHLAPSDHAQVAGLCTSIIGISPGSEQYDACLEGLSASVRSEAQGVALVNARSDCLRQRLAPAAALAQCELDRSRGLSPAGAVPVVLAGAPPLKGLPRRLYWAADNAEVHRREQNACARLGLEPLGGAFNQCVAQLDASLFAANNPSQ